MYKLCTNIFVLVLCLNVVTCDLGKDEGADCEWGEVKGKCVNSRRCMTTLDKRSEDKHPVCSKKGEDSIICCTDCQLINDTSNVIISPKASGIFFKDGRKARNHCLDFWNTLPYLCLEGGFYGGISRSYNEQKKCHDFSLWGIGGAPPPNLESGVEFPHKALLGYGKDLNSVKWLGEGTIISENYILTAAHLTESLKYVALGVKNRSGPSQNWQILEVEVIVHPEYQTSSYKDVALLKTKTPIQFNKNVLPACLPSDQIDDEEAITTTYVAKDNTIHSHTVQKYSKEECSASYSSAQTNIQMCFGDKNNSKKSCEGVSSETLLVNTYITDCIYTVIGLASAGNKGCEPGTSAAPTLYTNINIDTFVPWIESVVWP